MKWTIRNDVLASFGTGVVSQPDPKSEMLAEILLRLERIEAALTKAKESEHQWGQDTEYTWYQSCKCQRCSATTARYAYAQANASAPDGGEKS